MKKDDRNNIRKERFIMMSTSALVLTALTLTGVYMRNRTQQAQDKGYTIDFSALENRADDKWKDIAKSSERDKMQSGESLIPELESLLDGESITPNNKDTDKETIQSNDKNLKVDAGKSDKKEMTDQSNSRSMSEGTNRARGNSGAEAIQNGIEGSSAEAKQNTTESTGQTQVADSLPLITENENQEMEQGILTTAGESVIPTEDLHFSADTMLKPIRGEIILDYSMDHSVYFATLDQYKYNPAVIYGASRGDAVYSCNRGRVINVHEDPELGSVLVMDLGDGYQAIYGQLENISVPIGATVEAGTQLATVAAPTKYYGKEGDNLYFQMKKDGKSIDPGDFLDGADR